MFTCNNCCNIKYKEEASSAKFIDKSGLPYK